MKYVAYACVFAAVLTFAANAGRAQIAIKASVSGADVQRLQDAEFHLGTYDDPNKSTTYVCNASGDAQLTVPKPGIYYLRVSAVDHEEAAIPLVVQAGSKDIEFGVVLEHNPMAKAPGPIGIIGSWDNFSSSDTMRPVTQNGKTIYTYTHQATADTLAYQLLGICTNGHSVNGTDADHYSYDGGGDYRSVLRTGPGEMVTITYDPAKEAYTEDSDLPLITSRNDPFLEHAITLSTKADAMLAEARVVKGGKMTLDAEKYEAMVNYLKSAIERANAAGDTLLAPFAAVTLASEFQASAPLSADIATLILRSVPPSSYIWAMAPMNASSVLRQVDTTMARNYRRAMMENPEKIVRAYVLSDEMADAFRAHNEARGNELYATLKAEYDDVSQIHYVLEEYDPASPTKVGRHVPHFSLALLDGSHVSDTSLLGKYYMIDFWATWCGPCRGEMPALHKAYAQFKGRKGFDILSISMDAAQTEITKYRESWPMPWMNAFIPGVWDAELAKEFEIVFIPHPILVGPDGTILANEEAVRGDELAKTLRKFLGEAG